LSRDRRSGEHTRAHADDDQTHTTSLPRELKKRHHQIVKKSMKVRDLLPVPYHAIRRGGRNSEITVTASGERHSSGRMGRI